MAFWPGICVRRVRFVDAVVPLASGMYSVVFAIVDNLFAAAIDIDASRLLLQVQMTSWVSISTQHVRATTAAIPVAFMTSLSALDTA